MMPTKSRLLLGLLLLQLIARSDAKDHAGSIRGHDRRTQECSSLDVSIAFSFNSSQMDTFYEAVKLANLDEGASADDLKDEYQDLYEIFEAWQDCDDLIILAKTSANQCIITFQPGTNEVLELMRNLNPFATRIETSDCVVRRGYSYVYDKSDFADSFHSGLDACVSSCGGTPCPLVLTGHSIGGAMALSAGIDLRAYSPTIVTFGATKTIMNPTSESGDACTDFPGTNHYQFVNVVEGEYDGISMDPSPFLAVNFGHLLFLGDDSDNMIGYPGLNKIEGREPASSTYHGGELYQAKIERLKNSPCMPIAVAKWGPNHVCHYNDECDSGTCQDSACV